MKFKITIIALLLGNILFAANLNGVVYNKASNAPLDDCLILLMIDGKMIKSANTTFSGQFSIPFKKNQNYTFEVVKAGYKTESVQIKTDQEFMDNNPSLEIYLSALTLKPKFEDLQESVIQKQPNPDIMEDIGDLSNLPEGYKIIEAKPLKFEENKKKGFNVSGKDKTTNTNVNVEVLKETFNKDNVVANINSDKDKFPSSFYAEGNIYYGPGKALLTENVKEVLDGIAKKLIAESNTSLKLVSFADSQRELEIGDYISKLRAEEVTSYLISKGVNFKQVQVSIRGNTTLDNECYKDVECDDFQHQENRRIDLLLVN